MGGEALPGMCAEVMSMSRCVPNCVCSSGLHSSRTNKMSIQKAFRLTYLAVEKYFVPLATSPFANGGARAPSAAPSPPGPASSPSRMEGITSSADTPPIVSSAHHHTTVISVWRGRLTKGRIGSMVSAGSRSSHVGSHSDIIAITASSSLHIAGISAPDAFAI